MKINHASLFTGFGGFDLAGDWLGWNNVFQVENNAYCNNSIRKEFSKRK